MRMRRANAIALALAAIALAGVPAFAQSGATGGTLGKSGKSVSGAAVQKKAPQRSGGKATEPATVSVAGRWNYRRDCKLADTRGVIQLQANSDGSFSGNGRNNVTGIEIAISNGIFANGKISYISRYRDPLGIRRTEHVSGSHTGGGILATVSGGLEDGCKITLTR